MNVNEFSSISSDTPDPKHSEETLIIPVIEEYLSIGTRIIETGKVEIIKKMTEEEVSLETPLVHENISIDRKAINEFVDIVPPPVRQEGDTTIISVVREVAVVVKKLLLVEELHITRQTSETQFSSNHKLRKEEIIVNKTEIPPAYD